MIFIENVLRTFPVPNIYLLLVTLVVNTMWSGQDTLRFAGGILNVARKRPINISFPLV